ncbi:MAG: putative phosphoenolpyruvate synthase [Candidatus Magasanikbacteria bacterium GW2011_GWC2_37_14]|uniref:Putative phosphoenolpyruvate synthase n=1 Tax=Candidatus Magasanikbacteria bacterium GW2011_GWC2_37_14 TaxID=1619046 RepID=A0A0G0GNG6_9BACT|nr:MAG: putative phosphoenolpyruvate synthase [Candidatus Magasanikbacteria bacterium GW2011_GWC2_37_14]
MREEELIKKFKKMPWRPWLKRYFPVLVAYSMVKGGLEKSFAKQGIKGEMPFVLFEKNMWYGTPEMFKQGGLEAEKYIKKLGMRFLVMICLNAYKKALREVDKMVKDKKSDPLKQYKKIIELLEPINVSIWTAHAGEVYFDNELEKKLKSFVPKNKLDEYIGDIGFPKRKNAHSLMVADILKGMKTRDLFIKYSWLKSRIEAGFGIGYTYSEIVDLRKSIINNPPVKHQYPKIPKEIKKLVAGLQDIVFLRTFRTDSLFEIYFKARSIFARLEKELGIDSVKYYLPEDIISGRLKRYEKFAVLKYYDDIVVTEQKIVEEEKVNNQEIKGAIAWKGIARGKVKIIFNPSQINKVEVGDILVTNMTIPAYLPAMKKAAAFVTDEGGITCHAAIIAREMRKPCITGTKFATKVLQDGDLVEVDADKGIIKKL